MLIININSNQVEASDLPQLMQVMTAQMLSSDQPFTVVDALGQPVATVAAINPLHC